MFVRSFTQQVSTDYPNYKLVQISTQIEPCWGGIESYTVDLEDRIAEGPDTSESIGLLRNTVSDYISESDFFVIIDHRNAHRTGKIFSNVREDSAFADLANKVINYKYEEIAKEDVERIVNQALPLPKLGDEAPSLVGRCKDCTLF